MSISDRQADDKAYHTNATGLITPLEMIKLFQDVKCLYIREEMWFGVHWYLGLTMNNFVSRNILKKKLVIQLKLENIKSVL